YLKFLTPSLKQRTNLSIFVYDQTAASKCYGYDEHGVMVAAADEDTLWDGGNACGKRYRVKCLRGTNKGVEVPCKAGRTVTVKIVDLCPSGCRGNIDLSAEAFKHIADPDEGKIVISLEEYAQRYILIVFFPPTQMRILNG
ncbi:unnamed protein product, partial [Linum tenue]